MRVLGLIPARGGSKGVPRKNIRLLAGRPLLAYTVDAALAAHRLDRVVLSTDDDEIAEVGRTAGVEAPFMRPKQLALDETPTLAVVQHALDVLGASGDHFDAVCLLQPTSPMRPASLIDRCIDELVESGADSVVSIRPSPDEYNPHWAYFMSTDHRLALATGGTEPITRRQDLPQAYHRDGAVYVTASPTIRRGSLYGAAVVGVVSEQRGVNIDTAADWAAAEAALSATAEADSR